MANRLKCFLAERRLIASLFKPGCFREWRIVKQVFYYSFFSVYLSKEKITAFIRILKSHYLINQIKKMANSSSLITRLFLSSSGEYQCRRERSYVGENYGNHSSIFSTNYGDQRFTQEICTLILQCSGKRVPRMRFWDPILYMWYEYHRRIPPSGKSPMNVRNF